MTVKVQKNDRLKIKLNEVDNILYLIRYIKDENKILIEDVNFDENLQTWIKSNEKKEYNLTKYFESDVHSVDFCLTSLNEFLVVFSNNEIIYASLKEFETKYKSKLLTTYKQVELRSIPNTDNTILIVNKNKIVFLVFSKFDETPLIIFAKDFHHCAHISIEGNLLVVIDKYEAKEKLFIYDLNEVKSMKGISKELFQETFNINFYKYLNITPNREYMAIFSEKTKLLKLYKIKNGCNKLLAEIPILPLVTCMNVTDEYVIIGIEDNRILSYLIVDRDEESHHNRIQKLDNR